MGCGGFYPLCIFYNSNQWNANKDFHGHNFFWQQSSPSSLSCLCSDLTTCSQSHSALTASQVFDSSSCFLPLILQSWALMVFFPASLFSYSMPCPSVIIHCLDLMAHIGDGNPDVYPALLSSRAKNSTASTWTSLLGYLTGTSNSTCPQICWLSIAALFPPPPNLLLFLKPILSLRRQA